MGASTEIDEKDTSVREEKTGRMIIIIDKSKALISRVQHIQIRTSNYFRVGTVEVK